MILMKAVHRVTSSVFCLAVVVLLLISCTTEPEHTASIEALMKIFPGQSSQDDILDLIGEPDVIVEGILTSYWDYYASDNKETLLRVEYNNEILVVSWAVFYDQSISVQDIIDRFGEYPIVFQVDGSEEITGSFFESWFVYPEQGVTAVVNNPMPETNEPIARLIRGVPKNQQEYISEMESNPRVRFIDWP